MLTVKKLGNKIRTEQNEEVNNKNKIHNQVKQSQEPLLIKVEKGDIEFKLKKMTTARIIATSLSQQKTPGEINWKRSIQIQTKEKKIQ
jgi:hypothetical protein